MIRNDHYAIKLKSPGLSTPDYSTFEITRKQHDVLVELLQLWGKDFNKDCLEGF